MKPRRAWASLSDRVEKILRREYVKTKTRASQKSLLLQSGLHIFLCIAGMKEVTVLLPRAYSLTKGNFYGNCDEIFNTCGNAF
jgi:hypothetical protein